MADLTSGTSYFLIKTFYTFRQVVVDYPTDIRLVDTHAESNRGAYYLNPVIDKIVLRFLPLLRRQSGMINPATNPLLLQHLSYCLRLVTAHTVNNPACSLMAADKFKDSFVLFLCLESALYRQTDIGTVERGYKVRVRQDEVGE